MFNPNEYLKVVEEFKTNDMLMKCAISLIEKGMLEFARAPRLPWVEIVIPAKMGKELRTKVSEKYKKSGWDMVASVQEEEETRFVFCTQEMKIQWQNLRTAANYKYNDWLII